jgi:Fe-S-cluster containining protein
VDDTAINLTHLPDKVSQCLSSHQNKMAQYLFEMAHMDGLEDLNSRRALPHDLLKRFRRVMHLFDESTLSLLGQLRRSGCIVQCRPQCTHCCTHMPAGLSTMELIYIYHGMSESGVMDRIFRHCMEADESWVEVLRQCLGQSVSEGAKRCPEEDALDRYYHLGQPCPFLTKAMCQIYPYRPFACRMHFSVSPPYWCNPFHFQNPHAVQFNLEPGDTVYDALEKLNNRFQLDLSDVMVCGLLELTVNVLRFQQIQWLH